MEPFIDFNNIKQSDINELRRASEASAGKSAGSLQWQSALDEFMKFVIDNLQAIHARLKERRPDCDLMEIAVDYDPKDDPEQFLKDGWRAQADHWALIETLQTYYLTMLTLFEKLVIPEDRHLMITSLGSGPGLYETFLAKWMNRHGIGGQITCVDFAAEMTEVQKFVISRVSPPLRNIDVITADMSRIPLPSRSQDAIFCNNSLQWCMNWRKAIKQMARVLNPERPAWAYIVVHLHKQAMMLKTATGESPIDMPTILVPDIMDELEKNRFSIMNSRQIQGALGTGQAGSTVERAFMKVEFTPQGLRHRWRNAIRTVSNPRYLNVNKE